jgi:hypothetical protein
VNEFLTEHPIVALFMVWAICGTLYKIVHVIVTKKEPKSDD